MILNAHLDASYLSASHGPSRAGGHFFLGSKDPTTPINGPILALAKILKNVMSSAAEAELGAMFMNAKEGAATRTTLEELGHNQQPTNVICDNSTAVGIANTSTKHKRSKAMDMCFYWLRDRATQNQFKFQWQPGKHNLGDHYTKHHPVTHHKKCAPQF